MSVTPVHVLLVEDSPADIRLTQEALRDGKILNTLHIVRDGDEALNFLHQRGEYSSAPRPGLVILDLNLPKRDGKEVLEDMKRDASLSTIPVAVLTTSAAERDIVESYRLGANCYLTKPVDLAQFLRVVAQIEEFWLGIVRLPSIVA
jgi:two-component system, chemotaxis family, response regulator Rcp1